MNKVRPERFVKLLSGHNLCCLLIVAAESTLIEEQARHAVIALKGCKCGMREHVRVILASLHGELRSFRAAHRALEANEFAVPNRLPIDAALLATKLARSTASGKEPSARLMPSTSSTMPFDLLANRLITGGPGRR